MAHRYGRLHEFGRFAEIGLAAGGVDQCADFAAAHDGAGKYRVAVFLGGRHRLSGQGGLIERNLVALQQPRVRGNDVAQPQADDIAGHQFSRRRGDPFAIALHAGFDRQPRLQRIDGVAGLAFLPESDRCIGKQQQQDDEEVRPVPNDGRQHDGHFDHPRDRPPEIFEKFQQRVGFFLFDLIGPVLGEALCRLLLSQPVSRGVQAFLDFGQGQGLEIILCLGRRRRFCIRWRGRGSVRCCHGGAFLFCAAYRGNNSTSRANGDSVGNYSYRQGRRLSATGKVKGFAPEPSLGSGVP
jgi:hypothetical protein